MKQISPSYPEIWESLPILQALTENSPLRGEMEALIEMLHRRDFDLSRGAGKEYASVVVAAGNTHSSGKEVADFVGDGVADEVVLQRAANSITTTFFGLRVGRIELLEGTFTGAGSVSLPSGIYTIQGQGQSFETLLSGISFTTDTGGVAGLTLRDAQFSSCNISPGSGGLLALSLICATILSGALTGLAGISASSAAVSGGDSATDLITISSGQVWLENCALAGTARRSINATDATQVRIYDSFTGPLKLTASGGLDDHLDISGTAIYPSNSGNYVGLELSGFRRGDVKVSFPPFSSVAADHGESNIILTNCENITVSGHSSRLGSAVPHVKLVASAGTCRNNSIVAHIFEGNAERSSGAGLTTYHVDNGAGVVGTKLAFNYYGGASSGSLLDNGTGTVILPGGVLSGGALSSGDDAALFWMEGKGVAGSSATTAAADETLTWMQGGQPQVEHRSETPTLVEAPDTYVVPASTQVLWSLPIDLDGFMVVDGSLVEVD